jgi:glycosyltransferase involved in cell wall biosynthesis
VCVIGSGPRFLSGISYYTNRLVNALAARHELSAVLMRQLLPTRLYPGRERVGTELTQFAYPPGTRVFDGVDWFWGRSLLRAIGLLRRERPEVVVLQWWTGTVLHTYLALATAARLLGIRVVIELHEALDTGEDRVPLARHYVRLLAPRLFRRADAFTVHSEYDRDLVCQRFGLDRSRVAIVPHARYDHYQGGRVAREAPEDVVNFLYFGIIRPFKGVDDLIQAFERLAAEAPSRYWLTVVGETWEGTTGPAERIAMSPFRDRITFVNRYVTDEEADARFGGADVVVLPYHRSSQSGPLHVAFGYGKPVVVTAVGGLVEACADYEGAVLVQPHDPADLAAGMRRAAELRGQRFEHAGSFAESATRYRELIDEVRARRTSYSPNGGIRPRTLD